MHTQCIAAESISQDGTNPSRRFRAISQARDGCLADGRMKHDGDHESNQAHLDGHIPAQCNVNVTVVVVCIGVGRRWARLPINCDESQRADEAEDK